MTEVKMKFVFISPHAGFYRHYDQIVRKLIAKGHSVHILFGDDPTQKFSDRAVKAVQADFPQIDIGNALMRSDWWKSILEASREMRHYRIYLKPNHPSPQIGIRRREKFPKVFRPLSRSSIGKKIFASNMVGSILRWIEKFSPADARITEWLNMQKPDAVIAVTNISSRVPSTDYLKAANKLHIPAIISIASWDNLTTKGTFLVQPDATFVWNNELVKEAIEIHELPVDNLVITGSPTFDYWFDSHPDQTRKEFCEQVGIDPSRKFIVYLCSSRTITGDETSFVSQFAECLLGNPDTGEVIILVRPHPLGGSDWGSVIHPNVVIWPAGGDVPDMPSSQQNYFNTLYYSECVTGVNTSAMVEAAIVDKPCVTILTEQYRQTQMGRGHFYHLLNAEYMEIAEGFESSAKIIAELLAGRDLRAMNRAHFVKSFLRPHGLEKNVSDLFVHAIEMAAQGETPQKIQEKLSLG
jgi:hypothetical protein